MTVGKINKKKERVESYNPIVKNDTELVQEKELDYWLVL